MNPFKQLLGETAIYGLSSIFGRLLNYLLVPIYTRYFLPEEYGVVTELYAYVAFLAIILTYGMETALFRFSKKEEDKNLVFSTSLISLLFSAVFFLVGMILSKQVIANALEYPTHPEYVVWFAWVISLDAISAIIFAKLREQNKAKRFALIRMINILVNIGLNLFFIVYCPFCIENQLSLAPFCSQVYDSSIGVGYIFIANWIASISSLILLYPELKNVKWRFDFLLWKKMMIYALPLLVAGLAGIINETMDRILLKYLLPNEADKMAEIGIYGAFYKIAILMTLFTQAFRFAAEPFFFAQEKNTNSKQIYADVLKYFTLISSFIFLVVMLHIDFIIHFVGSNFHTEKGKMVVPILLMANLFLGIYYNLSIWYKLTEKTSYGALISVFGAGITLWLNILLIPTLGFVGSAWATLACYFSIMAVSFLLGRKYYRIDYDYFRIVLYIAMAFVLYRSSKIMDASVWVNYLLLTIFIVVAILLEKPKKAVNSEPK